MNTDSIKYLVLDEYDKILEVGFEEELSEIISFLPNLEKRVLTSATSSIKIPGFVNMTKPTTLNYLEETLNTSLKLKIVETAPEEKIQTIITLFNHIGNQGDRKSTRLNSSHVAISY